MNLIALLAFTLTLLTGALATDEGGHLDPNGRAFASDIGCGIDPNGCNSDSNGFAGGDGLDAGSAMDPNGRGWGIDPNG